MTMKRAAWTLFSVLIIHNITEITSQLSPWFPEQCDYELNFKCGDMCLSQWSRCYCGGEDWSWFDDKEDKRYCCVPPGSQCTKVDQNNVNCSSGVLLPWCTLCHGTSGSSPIISSVTLNDTNIDLFGDLQSCTTLSQTPGLKGTVSNGACKPNYKWCTEDLYKSPCQSEVTRDRVQLQRFCQNSTFWESQDCNMYSSDGTVIRYGERCRSQQHCYYPAYHDYNYGTLRDYGYLPQCKDKSDQIFERHSQCNMSSHLDIYCDHCQENRSKSKGQNWWKDTRFGDCERKCGNKTKFIQQQEDHNKKWSSDQLRNYVLDPHNCQASCLDRGYGCTACENKKYFNCSSSSNCLHPDLVCDGVPQCPPVPTSHEPEDEELERCKQKGVFKSEATMKCQSIFHPAVTILAVPCNEVPECADNADESWICKNMATIISGVGGIFGIIILVFVFLYIKSVKRKDTVNSSM